MTDGTPPTEPQQPIEPASDVHSPPDVPTEPVEPAPGPDVRSDIPRQVALGAVVFIATLLLLVGATAIVRPAPASTPGGTAAMAPATTAPAASSTPSLAASPDASPQASPSMGPAPSPSVAGSDGPGSPSAVPPIAPQPTAATLVGAGDIADCGTDGDEATAALLDALPGTVFTAGDNAYPSGSQESFRDCYDPSWGRHKARTRPAAGNHDWETGRATGYLGYFGDAATGPDGATWYSYELGTWHIIVLDSDCAKVGGCDAQSPQGEWLAADLAASRAQCTLAIWHHPRFSSGEHGNIEEVDPFWLALYGAGADVVVNGHDHDYERFAPQTPDGQEDRERGIREFVVGTGGTSLRDFVEPYQPNSEMRAVVANGVIEFTLRDGGFDWRFIPTETDFSDRGSASCH